MRTAYALVILPIYKSLTLLFSSYDLSVLQAESRSMLFNFFDPTVKSLFKDLFEEFYLFLLSNSDNLKANIPIFSFFSWLIERFLIVYFSVCSVSHLLFLSLLLVICRLSYLANPENVLGYPTAFRTTWINFHLTFFRPSKDNFFFCYSSSIFEAFCLVYSKSSSLYLEWSLKLL